MKEQIFQQITVPTLIITNEGPRLEYIKEKVSKAQKNIEADGTDESDRE